MREKVVVTYDYYTLDQAREIVLAEMRHNRLVRRYKVKQRKKQRRAEKAATFSMVMKKWKQKLSGLLFLGIGIVTPVLIQDVTFSLISVPLGIYLMATKQEVMR